MRRSLVFLLFCLLSAGCTSDPATVKGVVEPASSSAATFAPAAEPQANESYGAIAGLVVDEEQLPVAGAKVILVEPLIETVSDPDGRFTINELRPGDYGLHVSRPGFRESLRPVEVGLDEATSVTVTLQRLVVTDEMYHVSINRVAQIHAGHSMLSWPIHDIAYVNQSTVNGLLCEPCHFVIHFDKGPKQILTEGSWAPGPGGVANTDVWLAHYANRTGPSANYAADYSFYLKSGGAQNWTSAQVEKWRNWGQMDLHVHGGLTTVNVEHRVDLWMTFAYHGQLPDGFTALAPK